MEIDNNIYSIHAKIWGHFIDPLQKMIKQLYKFTMKHKERDIIWLLTNLKTVSTEIDSLDDKHMNYFNTLKYFVSMRQGHL